MDDLQKIAYDCRTATFLIEKKQSDPLSARERIVLKIHLAGCSLCTLYEKQSMLITEMLKHLAVESQPKENLLSEEFKIHLQQLINKKFGEIGY